MNNLLISFIIPAYNAEHTIRRAIESILGVCKDKERIEIIAVENGSTDHTSNVVKQLTIKYGSLIKLYHSEKGVSNARNLGIQQASGEWIVFVDADDYLVSGAVDTLLYDAAHLNYDLITYNREAGNRKIYITRKNKIVYSEKNLEEGRAKMIAHPTLYMQVWGKLFRRQVIVDHQLAFDPELQLSEDSDFTLRYSHYCRSLCFSTDFVYHYSVDGPSTMRVYDGTKAKQYIYAMEKTGRSVQKESRAIQRAYGRYILMHLNILMVREVFVADNPDSFFRKLKRMRKIADRKIFARVIRDTKVSDCRTLKMMPVLMLKLRADIFAGAIFSVRAVINARREKNCEKGDSVMHKVLIFGMTENPGGVEAFLMNYYRKMDRDKLQFDFLCNSYEPVAYEDELLAMGGHTYHFPARSKKPFKYYKKLNQFFALHAKEYDAIWVNVCSLANIDYLKMAKKYGISRRIIHSHNSQNMDSRLRGILHQLNKRQISRYATDYWACSADAAKWFYPEGILEKAEIIHNAIDVDKMAYDSKKRELLRREIGCEDSLVIGNVGRLHFQKNQTFLLDIFAEVLALEPCADLVLVGQGEDLENLKEKAHSLGITEHVHFMGVQYDVAGWLSAFDLFLFPSLFEGLSVVALEAQANGLPVLASSGVIPEEVRMNENFQFFSLERSAKEWAKKVLEMRACGRLEAADVKDNFIREGYDINAEAEKLERSLCSERIKR
jgi:glycosyltransferase involved in cell wall biosynthesis